MNSNPDQPMRQIFGETLVELAEEFPQLVVLDADVSSSTQTRLFAARHPKRFFNFGIAEANMVSAAAGMAVCGRIPVVSTFAFLLALRAGDPVRSLVAYSGLNVKLAGGYAGLSDYADGASHQSVCDLAVMTAIPGIVVVVPSDATQTRLAVRAMLEHRGPVYLRLCREKVGALYPADMKFEIGKGYMRREGKDVTIITCGMMVCLAEEAAAVLATEGISTRVVDMATIKPLDQELVLRCARETGAVVTVEEHTIHGGLGSAVAELLAQEHPTPVLRCGIQDRFGESGTYGEILTRAGISVPRVVELARKALAMKKHGGAKS